MNPTEPAAQALILTNKIYTIKAIQVATFIGGPLVAGYLIAENYKAINEHGKAKTTWIYAVIATVIIFGLAISIADNDHIKIPTPVIPLIYSWITYWLVQTYQKQQIDTFLTSGGTTYSWWRTIGISLAGAIITFGLLFITLSFIL